MAEPYVADLKDEAKDNDYFRKVLFTGSNSQLVVMSLKPGEEIGTEVHKVDQLIYIVDGEGEAELDGAKKELDKGTIVCVPAGVRHNVVNSHDEPMKIFTVYAPPQHAPGTVHRTKEEAERGERVEALKA